MSHSKIFQISSKPIAKDDYREPSDYYENSDDFADYIGERVDDNGERDEEISHLAELIKDVFVYAGDGVFVYKGKASLTDFNEKWNAAIKQAADELTADIMHKEQRLYRLRCLTEETHLESSYRVDIAEWTGDIPYPLGELFVWAENELTLGDKVYVGAVIDFHY